MRAKQVNDLNGTGFVKCLRWVFWFILAYIDFNIKKEGTDISTESKT